MVQPVSAFLKSCTGTIFSSINMYQRAKNKSNISKRYARLFTTEHSKILYKKTWVNISCTQLGRRQYSKVVNSPKLINIFNAICIRIPAGWFW